MYGWHAGQQRRYTGGRALELQMYGIKLVLGDIHRLLCSLSFKRAIHTHRRICCCWGYSQVLWVCLLRVLHCLWWLMHITRAGHRSKRLSGPGACNHIKIQSPTRQQWSHATDDNNEDFSPAIISTLNSFVRCAGLQ
mgnify:CR=1 FL=1